MRKIAAMGLSGVDVVGAWVALLGLRIVLGWEYFESGLEKFNGENWFADIRDRFPPPFDLVPPEISWQMATWFELAGGVALAIGLGTRFFGASLFILTIVAIASAHWPADGLAFGDLLKGYVISDKGYGNFKLPLIFLAMLVPLILSGPGKLSLDALIRRKTAAC